MYRDEYLNIVKLLKQYEHYQQEDVTCAQHFSCQERDMQFAINNTALAPFSSFTVV